MKKLVFATMMCVAAMSANAQVLTSETVNNSYENAVAQADGDYAFNAAISHGMVADMRHLIAQCQEMMGISDEDLENYRRKRQEMEKKTFDKEAVDAEVLDNAMEWEKKIMNAKKKLNLE